MRGYWWRSEWFASLMLVVASALTLRADPLAGIEGWAYDLASRLSPSAYRGDEVVVVAIDAAVQGARETNWSREQARHLLTQLDMAGVRSLTLFWPLEQEEAPAEVMALRRDASRLLAAHSSQEAAPLLQRMASLATGDERLAAAMRGIDELTIAALPTEQWSDQWRWSTHELITPLVPTLQRELHAAPPFLTAADRLAHDTLMLPASDVVRRVPLLYRRQDGSQAATLPLHLLAQSLEVDIATLRHSDAETLTLGDLTITTDSGGYLVPRWSSKPLRILDLDALDDITPALLASLHDRIVLAGPLSARLTPLVTLPDGREVAPVELAALTLTALTAQEAIVLPPFARWLQLAALLLVALLLTLVLPRMGNGLLLATGIVSGVAILNAQLLLFLLRHEWLPLTLPLLVLLAGVILMLLRRRWRASLVRLQQQLGQVTVSLAQQLRQQGQLDDALFHLQQCSIAQAGDELYQLGLDYERKRQYSRAEHVFAHIARDNPRFRDAGERSRINREASERLVIAGHPSSPLAATLVMEQTALQKPVVGRYQVERELGRGAMGMVYLGHDPKISRTVAIKTVSLADEYDAQQLKQVRERFFREAESAGRLSHPHIVTIYDVGEEGDLAYIAMDYLNGTSLEQHTSKETLLPVEEVLAIVDQVAEALDYAHCKGVIHRDIKPANIIYDRERHKATVTDFGVAHLADASKTRTGTILGSPYYMAPEQLAGSRVDGRADLFSLGVTLYQLLTGSLPFEADSIATLMYKITHSRHVSVGKLRRGVPNCASRIVNQLLQKDVEKRFQSGGELHKALQRCMK